MEKKGLDNNPVLRRKFDNLVTSIKALVAIKHMKTDPLPIEIIPGLYIGSVGAAFNKKSLDEAGITHILSVVDHVKKSFPNVRVLRPISNLKQKLRKDFIYKEVPVLDKADTDLKKHFRECGQFINDVLSQEGKKVLMHW